MDALIDPGEYAALGYCTYLRACRHARAVTRCQRQRSGITRAYPPLGSLTVRRPPLRARCANR
jgi:hypothetical protein